MYNAARLYALKHELPETLLTADYPQSDSWMYAVDGYAVQNEHAVRTHTTYL